MPVQRRLVRRLTWAVFLLASALIVCVIGGGIYLRQQLRDSLPAMTGELALPGLDQPVTVDRDRLGIPTITASSRRDAARALGFLHAQERFFQMDLQRRQAAGELAALVGPRAVEVDKTSRVHRFRHVARQAVKRATPEYRDLLSAYTDGVNSGLRALAAPPFEYLLLRLDPQPWQMEDTLLTGLAMFNTLQGRQASFEATFGTLADAVPPAVYGFLSARGSEWDAPVIGTRFPRPAIPGADAFDVRRHDETSAAPRPHQGFEREEELAALGSNNWAVAGSHTASGSAIIANDMHLAINVPNIWYRAAIRTPDTGQPGSTLQLAGVTLPGLPSIVVGSNGHVAWGFTNSGGDWSDLVIVEPDERDPTRYRTPDGPREIERFVETIAVAGGEAATIEVRATMWGPIVRTDHRRRMIAQHWVAHDPTILAADVTAPERARTLDEVLDAATKLGIPAQNFVAGDRTGRIGWTIGGPIPRREGFDGSMPTSWADGARRWNGYLTTAEYPRIVDPPSGRIWTANSPVVDGEMLARIGEGGYADGIRARIIRDRLLAIEKATPAEMLSIQLDNSALFLERWRSLALALLTSDAVHGNSKRVEFRRLVESTWSGRADPASVAYRLVRTFRLAVARAVFLPINTYVGKVDAEFDYSRMLRSEGPLWQLVTERPLHLLDERWASWDALLLGAIDSTVDEVSDPTRPLSGRTWGEMNRAAVLHPLGAALPVAGRWLNMPADELPGDIYTPRAHSPRTGPSERMVVSPGREHEGILHMPGGQSGHPLSTHYTDQHRAWVTGAATPFLPGPSTTRLTLRPH